MKELTEKQLKTRQEIIKKLVAERWMKEMSQEDMRTQSNTTSIQVADQDVDKGLQLLKNGGIEVKGTEQATTSLEDFYFGLIGGGEE